MTDRTVYINSPGGGISSGSDIYHMLKNNCDTVITGVAASISGVIAMAGRTVKISPPGQMMIHNVGSWTEGDYRAHQSAAENLKELNSLVINVYKDKTGLSPEELQAMMDKETWLTAETALSKGFVDEILKSENNQPFI